MNRSELIARLAQRFPQLTVKDVDAVVKTVLDQMGASLAGNGRVEIRGFGSFDLSHRKARTGRNPKTGVLVSVPAKFVPHFRAGKEMRERVDCHAPKKK